MRRFDIVSSRAFATTHQPPESPASAGVAHDARSMESRRPRILLADDHRVVAEGIARIVADAFDVIDIHEDGESLVQAAISAEVDIIVADVAMPRMSGLKALKALRAQGSCIPFVCLSMHSEPAIVTAAMRAGANGYVLKSNAGRDLLLALETVLNGHPYLTPSLAAAHLSTAVVPKDLTERQHAVLVLIAKGQSTKQIAHELGLSTRTVEAHRYLLMQTFHVHTAIELVRSAQALGLLAVDDVPLGTVPSHKID